MAANELDTDLTEPRRQSAWSFLISWPALLMLGLILYELTDQPSLGVVVLCLKLGWEDFRTARWLRRQDPERGRGRACFWLFSASGLWKIAATASLLILVLCLLVRDNPPGNQPGAQKQGNWAAVEHHLIEAFLTALIGFTTCILATSRALGLAWWHGNRLWLDSRVHYARRHALWPPPDDPPGRKNRAGALILTSLIAGLVPLMIAGLVAVATALGPAFGPNRGQAQPALIFGVMMAVIFVPPILILVACDYIRRRLLAGAPSQCWGLSQSAKAPTTESGDSLYNGNGSGES
jgi:hypothetical protein